MRAQKPCEWFNHAWQSSSKIIERAQTDVNVVIGFVQRIHLLRVLMRAQAGAHSAEKSFFLRNLKPRVTAMRGSYVCEGLHFCILFFLHRCFSLLKGKLLSVVIGAFDFLVMRIFLSFPPIGLGRDEEPCRVVGISLLKLTRVSARIREAKHVNGLCCRANEAIGCGIFKKISAGGQYRDQKQTHHVQKNPRGLPRGGRWDGGGNLHTLL